MQTRQRRDDGYQDMDEVHGVLGTERQRRHGDRGMRGQRELDLDRGDPSRGEVDGGRVDV